MFFNKIANRAKAKKHKKRGTPGLLSNREHQHHKAVVFIKAGGNLELFIYKKIIRRFRKWVKRKKYKIRFRFTPNHIFSTKNKNSRMGKGKGKYKRLLVRFNAYDTFMVVEGISHLRLIKYFRAMELYFRNVFVIKPNDSRFTKTALYSKF